MQYSINYHIVFSSESVTQSHALTKTLRGYTGHEHLPHFALINMNGRMYDPVLGRMLSPDNYVQNPNNAQNYNRYTYVLNNPLKYTDPSGEFWHLVIGAVTGGTLNWLSHEAQWNADGAKYFAGGASAGALSAGIGAGVSSALAGTAANGCGFVAGFLGTNTISTTGIIAGSVSGMSSGITSGLITGTGNGIIAGDDYNTAFVDGLEQALIQGITGAVIGGVMGGIDAKLQQKDVLTGSDKYIERYTNGEDLYSPKLFDNDINPKLSEKMIELPVTDNEFTITINAPKGTYITGSQQIVPKGEGYLFQVQEINKNVLTVNFQGNPFPNRYLMAVVKKPITVRGGYFYKSKQTYSGLFMFLNYFK